MTEKGFIQGKLVSKFQLNANLAMWIRRVCLEFWQISLNVFIFKRRSTKLEKRGQLS